jgi:lysyl-tRNA synthetase class 2
MTEAAEEHGRTGDHPADDRWPDQFATGMLVAATFVAVVAVVPPWHRAFLGTDDPVSLLVIPVVPSLVYAALLLVMGVALRRRLRAAWWLLVGWWLVVPELGRVLLLVEGTEVLLASVGLVVMGVVTVLAVRARGQFAVHRVSGSLRRAVAVFLVGGAVVLLGGAALVTAFGTSSGFGSSAAFVLGYMLTDVGRLTTDSSVHAPWWVHGVIGLSGAVVVVTAATVLFRPPRGTRTLTVPDEAGVRTLLRDFGDHDSLGYFATRRDKTVVWDDGEPAAARSGVSYRVIGSVCLASGNPLGDAQYWPDAIRRWQEQARGNGWSLAVMAAGHDAALAYAKPG